VLLKRDRISNSSARPFLAGFRHRMVRRPVREPADRLGPAYV
jgi:hypothetical protein